MSAFDGDRKAAVIVAHPDDETLWAGGTVLLHPDWRWTVVALCRRSDADRAPKFRKALARFGASGNMADLDDQSDLRPLAETEVTEAILSTLPGEEYDLIITHGPRGEYTRHLRHEETCRTVAGLWEDQKIRTREMWMFAYEDGNGRHLPCAIRKAHRTVMLPLVVWREKRAIIEDVYGFPPDSFETKTVPRLEAFWCFGSCAQLRKWLGEEVDHEVPGAL